MARVESGGMGRNFDSLLLLLYLALVATGWLMIYAVGYTGEETRILDLSTRHGNQLVWVGISLFVGLVVLIFDAKFYQTFSYPIYIAIILALIGVLVFGRVIAGSKSWLDLGFFRFQPSEFGKFATCLALASYLSPYNISLQKQFKTRITALAIIGLPMILVLLQGDAGSALVYTSLLIVMYREGMPLPLYIIGITVATLSIVALMFDDAFPIILCLCLLAGGILINTFKSNRSKLLYLLFALGTILAFNFYPDFSLYILGAAAAVLLALIISRITTKKRQLAFILFVGVILSSAYTFSVNYAFYNVLKPHQQDRILVWLRPEKCDPLGALYNVTWSKRAIGSGGLTGKGFLEGNITKLKYVPEQSTDFIFCTVGEEQGFVGAFAVIMLYLMLLMRISIIAERQRNKFTRAYAYGVASILFFHLLINIGMTMGLMPVIGIPLPLISYGGSSLLAFTILLAILLKLDGDRLSSFR